MRLGPSTKTSPREDPLQSIAILLRWHILQEERELIKDANRQRISVAFLHEPEIRSTAQCARTRKRQGQQL